MCRASPAHPWDHDINVLNRGSLKKCRKRANSPQVQEQSTPLTLSQVIQESLILCVYVCVGGERECGGGGGWLALWPTASRNQGNPWKHSMTSPPPLKPPDVTPLGNWLLFPFASRHVFLPVFSVLACHFQCHRHAFTGESGRSHISSACVQKTLCLKVLHQTHDELDTLFSPEQIMRRSAYGGLWQCYAGYFYIIFTSVSLSNSNWAMFARFNTVVGTTPK